MKTGYYTQHRKSNNYKNNIYVDGLKEIDHKVNEFIRSHPEGKKTAVPGWKIKEKFEIRKDSEIQAIIERLRNSNLKGKPICANSRGYFIPATHEEFTDWLESYECRALKMIHTSENARKKWNEQYKEKV